RVLAAARARSSRQAARHRQDRSEHRAAQASLVLARTEARSASEPAVARSDHQAGFTMRIAAWLAAGCLLAATPIAAQQAKLGSRIQSVRDGMIQMHYAARPGVCGDGQGGIWTQGRNGVWFSGGEAGWLRGPGRG